MPHLFTNRPRQHNLFSRLPAGHRHFSWEVLNAILYLIGGLTFIFGSLFFFPRYSMYADRGAWIFFGGSIIYLLVTLHDFLEALAYRKAKGPLPLWGQLELGAAMVYLCGTVLFVVGSLLFLSRFDMVSTGSWCFIWGSLLFVLGAAVNILQIIKAGSLLTLQLLNATAVSFTLGATIFLLASVPYLWQLSEAKDHHLLFTYTAWEFIAGSVLFLFGGLCNFVRAYLAMCHYRRIETN